MPRPAVPAALALLAFVVALVQRPGEVIAETKVDLYVSPARFLADVTRVWSPTTDLGHVFGAQYGGYAWPMAPWFALGDAVGLPTWLVHRLWLGALLAVAAWGVVRLLDALWSRERGALHVAAGVLYVVNPYVTVYADRTSITLLSYAALPWLLLAIHRALREPRGWRWPAVFALVLTSTGGGVNVAVTAWLLLGPALLLVYERVWGGVGAGALRPVLVRLTAVNAVAQLWWVLPVLVQAGAAPSFLPFSEQPGTIWGTTSLPESLRLMGFWTSYVGVGYGGELHPFQGSSTAMLLLQPVVVAGLLVPAIALAAFPWTRRWRYAPFFLLMALVGLVVMTTGWPEGTPLRRAVTATYYRVEAVQFLRTTYKAGALVALSLAVLGGAAFATAWARGRARPVLVAGAAGLVALASWPLVTGRAVERQLSFDVPAAWERLADDLEARGHATRAVGLPGQLFGYREWGGTVDPILPALTARPAATRWIVPFADRRATDVLWTTDALVTQERARPGQLPALLDLLGAGDLVVAADGDRVRSGEAPAGDAARVLDELPGGQAYGSERTARPTAGALAADRRVPQLRRRELRTGGIVRVLPREPLTVVDGGAGGLAAMAAFGALDPSRPIAYAPDVDAAAVREAGHVVIADTNRRRAFVAARPRGQTGPTLPAQEGPSLDGTFLDAWLGAPRSQTVARLTGVESVTAPSSPQVTQFPERRPFAAIDGDPSTAWMADRVLEPHRHHWTVRFARTRDVPYVDVLPYSDSRGVVREVEVAGRAFVVQRGWNRLRVGLRDVRELRILLKDVTEPEDASGGAGGLREVAVPGLSATEELRPPVVAEEALRARGGLRGTSLTYLFERTTKDAPRRQARYLGERGAGLLRDAQDPEPRLRRVVHPPAVDRVELDGFATVAPRTGDDVLDRLLGRTGGARVTSSSRYEGTPRHRGSSAFDGDEGTSWIGEWIAGRPAWLAWEAERATTVRRLVLAPPHARVRRVTRVALSIDGRRGSALAVGGDGVVELPTPVRGRAFRLDVLDAAFPAGTPGFVRQRRAVGIGEVRGAGVSVRRAAGPLAFGCGVAYAEVGGQRVAFRVEGSRATFEAGEPVRLRGCEAAGFDGNEVRVVGSLAPLRVDALRMRAAGRDRPVAGGGRVLDAGDAEPGARDGVRIAASGPSFLVLGESYDASWRAECDGADLGEPRPMQGYANAWPIDGSCTEVAFAYGPQRLVTAGYAVSGIACLLLLVVAIAGFVRRRPSAVGCRACQDDTQVGPVAPVRAKRALVLAAAIALPFAFAFGLRAGAVALPVVAVVLWRGISDRVLGLAAAALLGIGVPLAYLLVAAFGEDGNPGGSNTDWPLDRIAAHWLALAGLACLGVVLVRTLALPSRRVSTEDDE